MNAKCFQWFHNTYPQFRGLLFHVPNEVQVSGKLGMKLRSDNKAKGVVRGIPDFVFMLGVSYGLEGKLPGKHPEPSQDEIHAKWVEHGKPIFIYRSEEEFQHIVEMVINGCAIGRKFQPNVYEFVNNKLTIKK